MLFPTENEMLMLVGKTVINNQSQYEHFTTQFYKNPCHVYVPETVH